MYGEPLLVGANASSERPTSPWQYFAANITLYWLFSSFCLFSWFFIGIPKLLRRQPEIITEPGSVLVHLSASFGTVVTCICNHWRTPKILGSRWKVLHIYTGRIGAVLSVIGAIFGELRVYMEYVETGSYNFILAAVGIWQIYCTVNLVRFIKRAQAAARRMEALKNENQGQTSNGFGPPNNEVEEVNSNYNALDQIAEAERDFSSCMDLHIHYTHALFYTACLGPLWARVFDVSNPIMGVYSKDFFLTELQLSENMCFAVFVAAQILMPTMLMRGSLGAKKRGAFV